MEMISKKMLKKKKKKEPILQTNCRGWQMAAKFHYADGSARAENIFYVLGLKKEVEIRFRQFWNPKKASGGVSAGPHLGTDLPRLHGKTPLLPIKSRSNEEKDLVQRMA